LVDSVGFVGVSDGKVVHNQGASDVAAVILPETRCERTGMVPKGLEKGLQLVIGKFASLWEAIHSAADFDIDVTIVDEVVEAIVCHDVGGNNGDGDAHVRVVGGLHGGAEAKILEIAHHAASIGGGDNAVEEEFGSGEICSFGADVTLIVNMIAADSPTNMVGDGLFRSMRTHNAEISGLATRGNGRHGYKEHGVSARDGSCALGQVVDFGGISLLPKGTLRAVAEFGVFGKFTGVRVECITMERSVWRGMAGSMIGA